MRALHPTRTVTVYFQEGGTGEREDQCGHVCGTVPSSKVASFAHSQELGTSHHLTNMAYVTLSMVMDTRFSMVFEEDYSLKLEGIVSREEFGDVSTGITRSFVIDRQRNEATNDRTCVKERIELMLVVVADDEKDECPDQRESYS